MVLIAFNKLITVLFIQSLKLDSCDAIENDDKEEKEKGAECVDLVSN